jgi:hypothetical protein
MHPFCFDAIDNVDNQVVDATTEKTFTALPGARGFLISVRTAGIYITFDGTVPSATNGLHIGITTSPVYIGVAQDFLAFGSAASCPTAVQWVR